MKFLILAFAILVVSWVAIRLNRHPHSTGLATHTRDAGATRSRSGRHQRGFFSSGRGTSRRKPAGKPSGPKKRAPSKGGVKGPLKKPWGW